MSLYQVFVSFPGENSSRAGSLCSRASAVRKANKYPASYKPEVRTLDNRLVWLKTPAGEAVDLESPEAFKAILACTITPGPRAEPKVRPRAFKADPGSLSEACKTKRLTRAPARPTWAQLEAAEAEAQARAARFEHFKR